MLKYNTFLLFLLITTVAQAQEKEKNEINTSDTISLDKIHSPHKATILSAFVPGLGQFYNKKYWKIPLVWGAYAGSIYGISFNSGQYNALKDIYKLYTDGDEETIKLYGTGREEYLKSVKDSYKRNRDLMFIVTIGVHVLNIIDANVDAHFFTFDVSEDLSFRTEPVLFQKFDFSNKTSLGLKISLNF